MPTQSPFPIDIDEKVNSPELLALLMQYGKQFYLDATEINILIQGLNYLYENIDPSANANLLTLGETYLTAYRGDRGKIAYTHSQSIGNPHGTTKANIGLSEVDNTSDNNKPVSVAQAAADAAILAAANTFSSNIALQLINGAPEDANTLKELNDKIVAVQAIIGGTTPDGDSLVNTVAELLAVFSTFPEGVNLVTLLAGKVSITDIYNGLDCIIAGKVADARQLKVLNDLISALYLVVGGKQPALGFAPLNPTNNLSDISSKSVALDNLGAASVITEKSIASSSYILLDSDFDKFLIFQSTCSVTVPSGLTKKGFRGIAFGYNAPVSFVAASGAVLHHANSENPITAEQFSVFGIQFLYNSPGSGTNYYSLFGRLQQL